MGINEKAADARQKKQDAKSQAAATAKMKEDDDYWSAHANPKGKKDMKREEEVGSLSHPFFSNTSSNPIRPM